jgi:hypothetical protein
MPGFPCGRVDFADITAFSGNTMNGAVRGRRLASPVRLALAMELGASLDGAWWPHRPSIAPELPELIDALCLRLGEITAISVNWSPWQGSPDLDALNRVRPVNPAGLVNPQRLMMVTGGQASATVLVVPSRTSSALATMVLRQAAGLPISPIEQDTPEFRASASIVRAARAESAVCAGRLEVTAFAPAGTADPAVPV